MKEDLIIDTTSFFRQNGLDLGLEHEEPEDSCELCGSCLTGTEQKSLISKELVCGDIEYEGEYIEGKVCIECEAEYAGDPRLVKLEICPSCGLETKLHEVALEQGWDNTRVCSMCLAKEEYNDSFEQ